MCDVRHMQCEVRCTSARVDVHCYAVHTAFCALPLFLVAHVNWTGCMKVTCTCMRQKEASHFGNKRKKSTRHATYAWGLIGSTADCLDELTVYVDEGSVVLEIRASFCGKWSPYLYRKRMVACILTRLVLWFCCSGTALSVLSRGVVVRAFRDALDHCAAPQNPCEAIPRDGSSGRSVGCPELREEWIMHHADVI